MCSFRFSFGMWHRWSIPCRASSPALVPDTSLHRSRRSTSVPLTYPYHRGRRVCADSFGCFELEFAYGTFYEHFIVLVIDNPYYIWYSSHGKTPLYLQHIFSGYATKIICFLQPVKHCQTNLLNILNRTKASSFFWKVNSPQFSCPFVNISKQAWMALNCSLIWKNTTSL